LFHITLFGSVSRISFCMVDDWRWKCCF